MNMGRTQMTGSGEKKREKSKMLKQSRSQTPMKEGPAGVLKSRLTKKDETGKKKREAGGRWKKKYSLSIRENNGSTGQRGKEGRSDPNEQQEQSWRRNFHVYRC